MANIGFGLQDNKNAKTSGYDLFQTTLGETLSSVASDAWKYNPVSSIIRLSELEGNRDKIDDEPLIDRQELNKNYSNLGLFFEEDEKQSTVDILVERKTILLSKSYFSNFCYKIITHPLFEFMTIIVIMLNLYFIIIFRFT